MCPPKMVHFFQHSYPFKWVIWAPNIPKESYIREAPLINRLSGGIQMGHNFDSISKKVAFCISHMFPRQAFKKNSEELIYITISGIFIGLIWTCFRGWYPNGSVYFTSSWYLYGSKFLAWSAHPKTLGWEVGKGFSFMQWSTFFANLMVGTQKEFVISSVIMYYVSMRPILFRNLRVTAKCLKN